MYEILETRIKKHQTDLDQYAGVLKRWDKDTVVYKTTQRSIIISSALLAECLILRENLTLNIQQ